MPDLHILMDGFLFHRVSISKARFQRAVLGLSDPKAKHKDMDARTYAKYILKEGTNEEKRELMGCFKSKLRITKGIVTLEQI